MFCGLNPRAAPWGAAAGGPAGGPAGGGSPAGGSGHAGGSAGGGPAPGHVFGGSTGAGDGRAVPKSASRREVLAAEQPQGMSTASTSQVSPARTLLKPEEAAALDTVRQEHQAAVLLSWTLEVLSLGFDEAKAPGNAKMAEMGKVIKLHAALSHLAETLALPVPFQYFHLLNLMVCLSCVSLGYIMACSANYGAPVLYFVIQITYMGLMELATNLSDPFGDDEVDFPVRKWLEDLFFTVRSLLEVKYRNDSDEAWAPVLQEETRLGFLGSAE